MAKKVAAKIPKKAVKKSSRKPAIGAVLMPTPHKSAAGKKSAGKKSHRYS